MVSGVLGDATRVAESNGGAAAAAAAGRISARVTKRTTRGKPRRRAAALGPAIERQGAQGVF
jgi:hypothetical protein